MTWISSPQLSRLGVVAVDIMEEDEIGVVDNGDDDDDNNDEDNDSKDDNEDGDNDNQEEQEQE